MPKKKKSKPKVTAITRSSAVEYLTFVAAQGEGRVEAIYADEDIWLGQKMMDVLYDVNVRTVNEHLKKIFADSELQENAVIRKFRITASDGKNHNIQHEVLQDAGKVTAEIAKAHAESEFEKYRIVQDRLFESDFDREIKRLEANQEGDE